MFVTEEKRQFSQTGKWRQQ